MVVFRNDFFLFYIIGEELCLVFLWLQVDKTEEEAEFWHLIRNFSNAIQFFPKLLGIIETKSFFFWRDWVPRRRFSYVDTVDYWLRK